MKRITKFVCLILSVTVILTSCGFNSNKAIDEINTYLNDNNFNACLEYVKELNQEEKNAINDDVCNAVTSKFLELKSNTKIDLNNVYDLSAFDTLFTEKCQKLWNIISEFSIDKEDSFYQNCVYLHYYAEMIDYARFCEIFSLMKKVNESNYLDIISTALYEYETNGSNAQLKTAYDKAKAFNYNSFDPQQYLVSDFRSAHDIIVDSLYELNDAFTVNDSNTVATSINTLNNALTEMLYITDTLSTVNSIQKNIYNKLSTENLFLPFNEDFTVSKREFTSGISFSLNIIFGSASVSPNENNDETTTIVNSEMISKEDALKIVVNAINKTKKFKDDVEITLTETKNIQLTDLDSDTNLQDAEDILESQLNQSISQGNGTTKTVAKFSNGTDGTQTLNDFVPPSAKDAVMNSDAVIEHSVVKGSGGYVVTLKFDKEYVDFGEQSIIVNSLVNPFMFADSENLVDSETSYGETTISVSVNNAGRLIKMDYIINGVNKSKFQENNGNDSYEAHFKFENSYIYKFSY